MTKANDAYILKINQLTDQLTPENKSYLENLIVYVRGRTLLKNEEQVNASLYEISADILDAQQNGESAENFFSQTPKETGDELIKNFDAASPLSTIGLFLMIFAIINLFGLLTNFLHPVLEINLVNAILNASVGSLLVISIFNLITASVYAKKSYLYYISIGILWVIAIGVLVFINQKFASDFNITIQSPYDLIIIALIGTIFLLSFVLGTLLRERNPVAVFSIILIIVVVGFVIPALQGLKIRKNKA
ncbi:hypothetical protein [Weissella confusa]|uniref:hypothetical protein n=1 Tax=Weissella confusa TaxID=1583 RepID=UPI001080E468|nr:hypothetical protein [Weissella confusa]MBJ7627487.1 hypothetical protein [Weissella confusa]TGE47617.1 hypothetical protein C6P23_06360 [Weissella confusa]